MFVFMCGVVSNLPLACCVHCAGGTRGLRVFVCVSTSRPRTQTTTTTTTINNNSKQSSSTCLGEGEEGGQVQTEHFADGGVRAPALGGGHP